MILQAVSQPVDISPARYSGVVNQVVVANLNGKGLDDLAAMPGQSPEFTGDVFFVDGFIIHNRLLASRLGEGGRYSIHVASGKKNGL